jgi:hypothetical protein
LTLDLNGDGVSLLVAYALGLDPNLHQTGNLLVRIGDSDKFGISFYGANPKIEYVLEVSTDLEQWTNKGVFITEPDPSGQRTAWVDRDSPTSFLRLGVRLVPTDD